MAIIALDYDDTYNRFPIIFDKLRDGFHDEGHKVFIVTARNEDRSPIEEDLSKFDGVIYTDGKAKASVIKADIYIDDSPVTVSCTMEFDIENKEIRACPSNRISHIYNEEHYDWVWKEDHFRAPLKPHKADK